MGMLRENLINEVLEIERQMDGAVSNLEAGADSIRKGSSIPTITQVMSDFFASFGITDPCKYVEENKVQLSGELATLEQAKADLEDEEQEVSKRLKSFGTTTAAVGAGSVAAYYLKKYLQKDDLPTSKGTSGTTQAKKIKKYKRSEDGEFKMDFTSSSRYQSGEVERRYVPKDRFNPESGYEERMVPVGPVEITRGSLSVNGVELTDAQKSAVEKELSIPSSATPSLTIKGLDDAISPEDQRNKRIVDAIRKHGKVPESLKDMVKYSYEEIPGETTTVKTAGSMSGYRRVERYVKNEFWRDLGIALAVVTLLIFLYRYMLKEAPAVLCSIKEFFVGIGSAISSGLSAVGSAISYVASSIKNFVKKALSALGFGSDDPRLPVSEIKRAITESRALHEAAWLCTMQAKYIL